MVETKMAEFKMADIIKLSENEWVKSDFFESEFCSEMAESKMARIQDGCHHDS